MRSRRDQVQAHSYMVGRLSSALVHGEPDALQPPMRRIMMSSLGGLTLGALSLAAFLIWGVLSPVKAATPPTSGDLVVVPATGARYIDLSGTLMPVLNWASARMLLGGSPQVEDETFANLAGLPQGATLGIAGAPDALPAMADVNQGYWLACAQSRGPQPRVDLAIEAIPDAEPVGSSQAIVVAAGADHYLIWQGQRLLLGAPWIAQALGLGQAPVTRVSQPWLSALPAGPSLQPFSLPLTGNPGPVLGGQPTRVGQVLAVDNVGSSEQLYLVERDGLAQITATQAALDLASSGTAAAYPGGVAKPVTVSPSAVASAPVSHQPLPDGTGVPATPPADDPPAAGDVPCMVYPGAGGKSPALVWSAPPGGAVPDLHAPGVIGSATDANLVSVPSGGGALVRAITAAGKQGQLYLVTDSGIKFAVQTSDAASALGENAATALGYQANRAVPLPAALLGLLPTGPSLDLAPLQPQG